MPRRCSLAAPVSAQDKVLNLYSSRHYQTDEALYANFTKQTGIKVNRIEARRRPADRAHPQRRRAQPRRRADHRRRRPPVARRAARPVPAGEVGGARAAHPGQPARAERPLVRLLDARARHRLQQGEGEAGRDRRPTKTLADPKWKGRVCMRSSTNIYNLSLMGAMIDHLGEAKAEAVGAGRARQPRARPQGRRHRPAARRGRRRSATSRSPTSTTTRACCAPTSPTSAQIGEKIGIVFPNQATWGTHVNISGAGVLKNAPNREARSSSSSTWRATRRSATSPTATTSGRW